MGTDWGSIWSELGDDERGALLGRLGTILGDDLKFLPFAGTQSDAYFCPADMLLYGGKPAGGKALSLDTVVPVPLSVDSSGYKLHGDLEVGDLVYSADGREVGVECAHPVLVGVDVYGVEFSTGEVIYCSGGHEWSVKDRRVRSREFRGSSGWRARRRSGRVSRGVSDPVRPKLSEVLKRVNSEREYNILLSDPYNIETVEMLDRVRLCDGRSNYSVDVVGSIGGDEVSLPVEPYLFGLWLGDGITRKPIIGMMLEDHADIARYLPIPRRVVYVDNAEPYEDRSYSELLPAVLMMRGRKKYIPVEYLRASYEQRLELLRGLMDSDGTCDVRGHCEVGFSVPELAEDTCELVNSLGIKCRITVRKFDNDQHADYYRMKFRPDVRVFNLPRKAGRQRKSERRDIKRRFITDIRRVESRAVNCITVEGGLYCVGRSYIVSHNSALLAGVGLQEQHRSLLARRKRVNLRPLIDVAKELVGSSRGFSGGDGGGSSTPMYVSPDGKHRIHFGGVVGEGALAGLQGEAHDYLGIDEAVQIPEMYVRRLMGWVRRVASTPKDVRVRIIFGTNPALDSDGLWLASWFPCWLDPTYPNPAESGELRWFLPAEGNRWREVKEGEYMLVEGNKVYATSRTFIPSNYMDNPYVDSDEYASKLMQMDERERDIMMSGSFLLGAKDAEDQLIPSSWLRISQDRWEEGMISHGKLVAVGVDVVGSGSENAGDEAVVVGLFDCGKYLAFSEPEMRNANKFATSQEQAQWVYDVIERKFGCDPKSIVVGIDYGGGYGDGVYSSLLSMGVKCERFVPNRKVSSRTMRFGYGFVNLRTETYYRLREGLDPAQEGGSCLLLSPNRKVYSDLATPKIFNKVVSGRQCKKLEEKSEIKKRLHRSTDAGDATNIAYWLYTKIANDKGFDDRLAYDVKYADKDFSGMYFTGKGRVSSEGKKVNHYVRKPKSYGCSKMVTDPKKRF